MEREERERGGGEGRERWLTMAQVIHLSSSPHQVEGDQCCERYHSCRTDPPQQWITEQINLGIAVLVKPIRKGLPHQRPISRSSCKGVVPHGTVGCSHLILYVKKSEVKARK